MASATQKRKLNSSEPLIIIIIVLIVVSTLLGYYLTSYGPSPKVKSTGIVKLAPSATPHSATITVMESSVIYSLNETFMPGRVTVYIGYNSTVIWKNNDWTSHTVTSHGNSPDPRFDSWGHSYWPYNSINVTGTSGYTLSFTFTVPGTYSYFCSYHPAMEGRIIVKSPFPGLLATN